MSLTQQNIQNDEVDHRYLSVEIKGNVGGDGGNILPTAKFSSTRTIPYLKTCNQFELGIVRFSVPSTLIPIFFFPDGVFKVSLVYSLIGVEEEVLYEYSSTSLSPYNNLQPIYYVSDFIKYINKALTIANALLQVAQPLYTSPPPQIVYEASTRLLTLYAPATYDSTLGNPAYVGFSTELYEYFRSFSAIYNDATALPVFQNKYVLDINPTLTNAVTIGAVNYIKVVSDTAIVDNWEALQQVVISTNSVPVLPEMRATSGSSLPVQRSILTDFNFTGLLEDNALLQYYTQGYVRFYNLMTANELNTFDCEILWADKAGNYYPIYLLPTETANLKIEFRKKHSFTTDHL